MVRIFELRQNNRYCAQCLSRKTGTIRSVVSFSVRPEIKSRPDYHTRKQVRLKNQKTTQVSRGSGLREA